MIELRIANDDTSKKFINETIQNFHSYVPSTVSVGRRIDWVVFNEGKPVGMIGIGSSVYPPPKDILNYVKMKKEDSPNKKYKSEAQRKAVHASKADGGKGNPNKMKKKNG